MGWSYALDVHSAAKKFAEIVNGSELFPEITNGLPVVLKALNHLAKGFARLKRKCNECHPDARLIDPGLLLDWAEVVGVVHGLIYGIVQ